MQFNESWLRSIVNPDLSTDELAEKLTMAGLEVEELEPVAPPFSGVVVGHVISKEKHPDADKLSVCTVDVGDGTPKQIVCGAPNVAAGQKVCCALPGAILPGNFKIKPTKMRGVESGGMLCGASEIGLQSEVDGLHLLAEDAPVGDDVRKYLGLDEMVFTLKMTPNRADCLSVLGVAREVAALTGTTITTPSVEPVPVSIDRSVPVEILADGLCGRFTSRVIRGVNNSVKAPSWMTSRLEKAGLRSKSALVDISNYVMLELGRPSHMFDLSKLNGGLTVRWANEGEKIKLLNEMEVDLNPNYGVISDASGVQALAGIMGGDHTAVTEGTSDVLVEAAFWFKDAIAGRTRELNLTSDAAHRFERGVDYANIDEHLEYITQLVLDICGGEVGPIVDVIKDLPERNRVTLRHSRAERIVGMPFAVEQVRGVFEQLGFDVNVNSVDGDTLYEVLAPSYRFDMEIEEDLIEEVVRVVGYENLPLRPPIGKVEMLPSAERKLSRHQVRHALAALGYQEVVSYSFVAERWEADFQGNLDPVKLLNPIASHLSVMRSGMVGSLVDLLKNNIAHRVDRLKLFEVARTFHKNATTQNGDLTVAGFDQVWRVAGLMYGLAAPLQWGQASRVFDFFDAKGDVEALLSGKNLEFKPFEHPALHPGRCAQVLVNNQPAGFLGELHPKWLKNYDLPKAPIVFELTLDCIINQSLPKSSDISKLPNVVRDVALVVDQAVHASEVKKALSMVKGDGKQWLKSVILFDEFVPKEEGKGLNLNEKSLAFRLTLQAADKSLTDVDIDPLIDQVVKNAAEKCGARLR